MKRILPFLVFIALMVPALSFVLAQADPVLTGQDKMTPGSGPAISTLTNPLKVTSLTSLYESLLSIAVSIGYVLVAFFLLLSGFKFVTAQGNESKLEEAKHTFYYTIIGALIVIGAQTIFAILKGVVTGLNK